MKPREKAHMVALDALFLAFKAKKEEMQLFRQHGGSEKFAGRYMTPEMKAIAKLYNRLLDSSGMDGVPLEVKP
jgi:hypothetical protein